MSKLKSDTDNPEVRANLEETKSDKSDNMDPKPEKPYRFDTIKKPVTPTDFAMWESTLWDYLKAIKRYKPLLRKNLTWTTDKDNNRGFTDDAEGEEANRLTAEDKSEII